MKNKANLNLKTQLGSSLIEVLIAFILIAFLGSTVMTALMKNSTSSKVTADDAKAMMYARKYAELLTAYNFAVPDAIKTKWETAVKSDFKTTPTAVVSSTGDNKYTITITTKNKRQGDAIVHELVVIKPTN